MRQDGRFGKFGGVYVPEILVPALEQLEAAFIDSQNDPSFQAELQELLTHFAGRETPLYKCSRLSEGLGADIFLKRERRLAIPVDTMCILGRLKS